MLEQKFNIFIIFNGLIVILAERLNLASGTRFSGKTLRLPEAAPGGRILLPKKCKSEAGVADVDLTLSIAPACPPGARAG